jgi:hypothetical protein
MSFNKNRPTPTTNPYSIPKNNINILGLSNRIQVRPTPPHPQIQPPSVNTTVVTPGSLWGKPTWYLLHTLAEKVIPEKFNVIRESLLNTIYAICSNLPCPDCANHAKTYLNGVNFNTIKTKQDLKNMLFEFHNVVNKRKGYPIFNYNDIDSLYSSAITIKMIYNFMYYFEKKSKISKMISNDMYRTQIASNIKTWFNENIGLFLP